MINKIKKILILVIIMFLGFVSANADSSYKNELTRVNLSPVGSGDVKVTLYMTKPYTEPLRLLKKNEGEFVLILPETYNSAPQKPSISDVIGEVTDADIKLYSFVSNSSQNGYTKIVIKTNGLTNLYPEAVTVGGGHIVNKPKEEIKKIVAEQIKPSVPQVSYSTASTSKVQTSTANNQPAVNKQMKKDTPVQKVEKTVKDTKDSGAKENSAKNKKVTLPAEQINPDTLPVVDLPKIKDTAVQPLSNIEVPLEEIEEDLVSEESVAQDKEPSKENKIKAFFAKFNFDNIKNKAANYTPAIDENANFKQRILTLPNNILILILSVMLLGFAFKFAFTVIRNAKPEPGKPEDDVFDDVVRFEKNAEEEEKPEYSNFFKTLIDSEVKGDNPFSIGIPSKDEVIAKPIVEPAKTHEEVLNEDQNLTWQEKFRALQKNKKSLLSEKDDNEFDNLTENIQERMEPREDMHIENPIKKLKQDFKAVRKVLEKQKFKTITEQEEFVPEKIDTVEVVSFEDFQKNVQRPKVQFNKTMPIKSKAPKVLTQLQLGNERGLYLVEYKDKVSLIGYINDKVFKLNSYSSVKDSKLYARLSEKVEGKETYIVKFDDNKMLVDIDDSQMKLKLMY